MKHTPLALSALMGAIASGAAAQPDTWDLLADIEIKETVTETSYRVDKTFPERLQNGAIEVEITGYAAPALPGETITELMLVSDMGLCPFCGSLDHGAALQVVLADPIEMIDESKRITLRGTLSPVMDSETWQAAILKDASIVAESAVIIGNTPTE